MQTKQWNHRLGLISALGSCLLLIGLVWGMGVQGEPLGHHCGDVGPLPVGEWCGCTWGGVYDRRQPVGGAMVEMTVAGVVTDDVTALRVMEPYPYYRLRGDMVGANYGDLATLTARYGSRTVSRTVRLIPDPAGDQEVNLVLPETEHWVHWGESGMVRALLVDGDTLWLGLAEGLKRCPADLAGFRNLPGLSCDTYPLGQPPDQVRALAQTPDGHVWVGVGGADGGVFEFDGVGWITHTTGLASSEIHALAVAPGDGTVWAGASGPQGGLSRYDGAGWTALSGFAHSVEALTVDGQGRLWVGTDGEGVGVYDATGWVWYTVDDGLASNLVYALATEPGAVWAGTWAYWSGGREYGGVSRFNLSTATWWTFTTTHGLADLSVAAVAADGAGHKWFGTYTGGLTRLDDTASPAAWTTYTVSDGLSAEYVRSLAVGADGRVWAGTAEGVDRLLGGTPGGLPVAVINTLSPTVTGPGQVVQFAGEGQDSDEEGDAILTYDWQSSLDGPLSTFAAFTRTAAALSPGEHLITLRVQDDEGEWSEPVTGMLTVQARYAVYLPLVVRER